jgi:hypothetical protein
MCKNAIRSRSLVVTRCIDLKRMFGQRYRIKTDPAATSQNADPWLWIIFCKNKGEIYPAGGDDLMVMSKTDCNATREMRKWPELRVHQDASDFVVFRFNVKHFDKVAKQVGAKRKRQMSAEERQDKANLCRAINEKSLQERQNALLAAKDAQSPPGKTMGDRGSQ